MLSASNLKRIEDVLKDVWFENNSGDKFKFLKFGTKNKCTLVFDNPEYVGEFNYANALKGNVKNPMKPLVCGVGYLGTSELITYKGKTKTREYSVWNNMLRRCYTVKDGTCVTYRDCTVCEEWHNYQNFYKWCQTIPEFFNEGWCLDKDILVKGNKVYSPDTCAFVPVEINNLFTLRRNHRGEAPLGVSWNKAKGYFTVNISLYGKSLEITRVENAEEGFKIYKQHKEKYIKEVADLWKGKISDKVYLALYNYEININD